MYGILALKQKAIHQAQQEQDAADAVWAETLERFWQRYEEARKR